MEHIGESGQTQYNTWLIEPYKQDPDQRRRAYVGWVIKEAALRYGVFLPLALVVSLPFAAHGGVFSFVSSLFEEGSSIELTLSSPSLNSQTMPLLRAAQHIDPNPSKGGGDITIVEGSALLADSGPEGTSANISDYPASDQISIYVVREGDTLSQIAGMFGVSKNTIVWANDITRSSQIQIGQRLVILPISGVEHTVKEGETLAGLAKKYKGDSDEIAEFNGLDASSVLTVGATLIIPDGEVSAPVYNASTRYTAQGTSGASYDGYYTHPLPGSSITQGIHGYNGVDLAAPAGTPVVASRGGSVIISRNGGWNGGYGTYIVIAHGNGTQTLYAHLSSGIVYAGASVVKGQVIGYVGSTGRSTGAHLHFEVRGAQNPFAY